MQTTETLRGVVTRVFSSDATSPWMAGKLRSDDGTETSFAGNVFAEPGDKLELSGEWTTHPRFGRQFKAETGVVKMDESPTALAHLLATDKRFTGLGPARAKKLVDAALRLSEHGDLGLVLAECPRDVADLSGVKLEVVERAGKIWNEKRSYFQALAQVVDLGWSGTQAQAIVSKYGENAATIVKGDPYGLIGKIPRFGFRTVDAVARAMGVKSTDPGRLFAGVAYCLDRIAEDGNTWTTREDLLFEASQELRPDTMNGEVAITEALDKLIAEKVVYIDMSPEGEEVVADARIAQIEFEVFDRLINGLTTRPLTSLNFDLPGCQAAMATLNKGQRSAVLGFSSCLFGVISGSAGVGKTHTMRTVCTVAEENNLDVALCAPTGKAAKKLAHATGREASTIHRLLEPRFNPDTGGFSFGRHAGNQLEIDLVVVDEVSMTDIRLMWALLVALPPNARLLLVGDHHQIPSVGAGAILRDLLSARDRFSESVHVLTEIMRQAGVLARNTSALLDGVVDPKNSGPWGIMRTERGNEEGSAAICSQVVESLATATCPEPFGRDLDFAWDIQVLAPMRRGFLGTYALNYQLQSLRQRMLGNVPPAPPMKDKPSKPLPGDRIIWTKNDYELDLFNGTQAIVSGILKGGAMDLHTEDGRDVTIPSGKRKHVELAYAMTIHKAQGSEWPCVILVISSLHAYMKDRNLLYTGASRASESLTILGDMNGIRLYANTQKSAKRQTFGSFLVRDWKPAA